MVDFLTNTSGVRIAWNGPKTPVVRRALERAGITRSTQTEGVPVDGYRTVKPRDVAYIDVYVPVAQREAARDALLAANLIVETSINDPDALVVFAPVN